MPTLTMITESYRWDDDEDGDPLEFPTELGVEEDTYDVTPGEYDDEHTTVVDKVCEHLDRYAVEGSSSCFQPGMWYSDVDGYTHPYTGVVERYTFHLDGLDTEDQRAVWDRITSSSNHPAQT